AWAFREVRTTQPYVRVQVNKDSSLNFSDLIKKFGQESGTGSSKPSKPPMVRIDLLQINGARASLADLTTRVPFRRMVGPLHITLNNFQTRPDNRNPYAFSGTTDSGERFSWSGHFFLEPIRSEGEFSLENLVLSKYSPLYQDLVKFEIEDGAVEVRASYRLFKSATTNYAAVTNTSVRVSGMKVKDGATGQPVAELPEFRMTGASVDVWGRTAQVDSLAVTGGQLHVRRNRDAAFNVVELAQPAPTATNMSGGVILLLQSVTNVFAMLLNSTNQWNALVREIQVQDCVVRLDDQFNSRPVNLLIDDIDVAVRNVSNRPGTNMTAQVSLRWNTNGIIKTDFSASVVPPAAEANIKVESLEFQALDPYLEPLVDVRILRSRLGMDATVQLRQEGTNALPSVRFRGDIALEDLGAAEARTGEDMLGWKALKFSGIEANLEPPSVAVRELSIDDLVAHMIMETNGAINLLSAARLSATNTAPAPATNAERGGKGRGKPMLMVPTNAVSVQLPIDVSLAAIVFTNGRVQFTDRMVSPAAEVSIEQLNGAIRGVSSRPDSRADIDIHGQVEKTGPVHLKGALYPMFVGRDTTMEVRLNTMDLHPTGPYVGKFLGYRLSKGRLGVELKYEIRDGKVVGANLIKLDQFTLGEKVNSPDALPLPIKLGLAILKDRNGLIELDVPVEGRLDDPEFSLGRVVTRAVLNIITKIATSPFAALGAVFGGGGEELSYQEFVPGSAELQAGAAEKLDKLANGLFERPGLQLEIEGAVDAVQDGAALRRQKLEAELRLSKWQALSKSARAQTPVESVPITPEEFAAFIEKRYQSNFSPSAVAARTGGTATNALPTPGRAKPIPDAPNKGAVVLRSEPTERAPKAEAQTMADQVIGLVPLSDAEYMQLATQRAKRVRDYLLQSGKVSQDRILMSESGEVARTSNGTKVLLRLQ
ncbi:MAG TPA: DUF748 domain-containing protein, partial [Verrucomicrobiae bacterium]|nr:DUF748 domain-containing protein [Verrucomicrobiae bacterium]